MTQPIRAMWFKVMPSPPPPAAGSPTPLSLLARLAELADGAAWARFVELYTPLIYSWVVRTGIAAQIRPTDRTRTMRRKSALLRLVARTRSLRPGAAV